MAIGSKNKYRKYKYIIWSDEEGFFSLDGLSESDLSAMKRELGNEISKRDSGSDDKRTLEREVEKDI
jgi:hypothetical protein